MCFCVNRTRWSERVHSAASKLLEGRCCGSLLAVLSRKSALVFWRGQAACFHALLHRRRNDVWAVERPTQKRSTGLYIRSIEPVHTNHSHAGLRY